MSVSQALWLTHILSTYRFLAYRYECFGVTEWCLANMTGRSLVRSYASAVADFLAFVTSYFRHIYSFSVRLVLVYMHKGLVLYSECLLIYFVRYILNIPWVMSRVPVV